MTRKCVEEFQQTYYAIGEHLVGAYRYEADKAHKISVNESLSASFEDDWWHQMKRNMLTGYRHRQAYKNTDSREVCRKMFGKSWMSLSNDDKRMARNAFGERVTDYFDS